MLRLVFISVFIAISTADFVPIGFKNCNSLSTLNGVEIDGCTVKELEGGKKQCLIKQGTTPKIRVNFAPNEDIATMKTKVKAKIGSGSYVDFPMETDDACKSSLKCPLKKGTAYSYNWGIEMMHQYPSNENIQVNWILSRDGEAKDICFIFLVKLEA